MNIKIVVLVSLLLTFFNTGAYAQQKDKITKVVIDAGHGGEDPGCLGKKSKEKDINLTVALKLGKLITDNYDNVQVIYTRQKDVSMELYKRAQIANNHHADLFISIHCNAADNKNAHGVETYVMGLHRTEANQAVAKKENAAILLEKNYENNYEGFNPNSPEADVIFSLYTSAYLKNSASFASKVQNQLVKNTEFQDKKVKQAGFWVLYKVAMPSILVELGFLSNAAEEQQMIKEQMQEKMAISIYNGFVEYKNQMEGTNKALLSVPKETPAPQPEPKEDKVVVADKHSGAENDSLQVRFRVQFMALPEELPLTDYRIKSLPKVKKYRESNLWKYTAGDASTFEDAQKICTEVKKKYPDAFIIAFRKEVKISVSEARKLIKK